MDSCSQKSFSARLFLGRFWFVLESWFRFWVLRFGGRSLTSETSFSRFDLHPFGHVCYFSPLPWSSLFSISKVAIDKIEFPYLFQESSCARSRYETCCLSHLLDFVAQLSHVNVTSYVLASERISTLRRKVALSFLWAALPYSPFIWSFDWSALTIVKCHWFLQLHSAPWKCLHRLPAFVVRLIIHEFANYSLNFAKALKWAALFSSSSRHCERRVWRGPRLCSTCFQTQYREKQSFCGLGFLALEMKYWMPLLFYQFR